MYRINTANGDVHCPDGSVVRAPYDNPAYLEYAAWVHGGGEPEYFDGGSGVPHSVTRFQAMAALHAFGYLPQVEAFMAAPDTPVLAKLAWANALTFERDSPTVAGMAAGLGLDDAAIDNLFRAAASVKA